MIQTHLVSSRLVYVNSLFHSLSSKNITRLQIIQNCLAHFVCGTSRFYHVCQVSSLASLNNGSFSKPCYSYTSSLPLESQNTFPHICLYIHLLLRQDIVIQKRCSSKSTSIVPQFINLKYVYFNKSFSYDAPKLWNDMPLEIRTAPTLSFFKM